ncbi:MAG: TonB-dependent receptor, partial [Dokdonella sp.]
GDRVNATVALWQLSLDSELLFVGDAGNTEASRPSHREGVEVGLYWYPNDRITAEFESSWTRSHFRDRDPAGEHIPGAIPFVATASLQAEFDDGWYATARLRHFGPYPLIEDDSVRSDGSTVVNLRLGKRWRQFGLSLDLLNALDSRDHDIDYFYASRLPGEADEGIEDVHYHPLEPRTVRLTARWNF